jgi:hypothetical protein
MARLIERDVWVDSDSLAMHLYHGLSDEYLVVAEPVVHGHCLDLVVIGPQGLFVLHEGGHDGRGSETAEGGEPASDRVLRFSRAEVEQRMSRAGGALKAFLRDEFRSLNPKLHHLVVLDESEMPEELPADIPTAPLREVVERIQAAETTERGGIPDWQDRADLAVGLRDRGLTASQRAEEPFVFRSGRSLGSGTEVWTIRDVVHHMDADPESGIYHLRNGTLEEWFHDQGAKHLARLARDVMREDTDHRVALEQFLIGTGLVSRPRLQIRPKQIDLGYALAGEPVARRFRLGKGGGRGYLFGTLEPGVPWLSVHPREFTSDEGWSFITVRADTDGLPITQQPRVAPVHIDSNASAEPVDVPIRVRIMGLPSTLNRVVLRPGATLLMGGFIGAVLGWILALRGVPAVGLLRGSDRLPGTPEAVWVAFMALIWALVGALRGAGQPEAWPIGYTMRRWLGRIGVWVISLGLTGAAVRWGWAGLRGPGAAPLPSVARWALVAGPVALAVVPATLGEIRTGRDMWETSEQEIRWSFLRPLLLPAGVAVLALLARLGAPVVRPVLARIDFGLVFSNLGSWIQERLVELETFIASIIDELYLRYYEG